MMQRDEEDKIGREREEREEQERQRDEHSYGQHQEDGLLAGKYSDAIQSEIVDQNIEGGEFSELSSSSHDTDDV